MAGSKMDDWLKAALNVDISGFRGAATGAAASAGSTPAPGSVSTAEPLDPELLFITVDPTDAVIESDRPLQFTATFEYLDGTTRVMTNGVDWSSSNPAIKIDAGGVARADRVSANAKIVATDPETGLTGEAKVSVAPPKAGPSLTKVTISPRNPALVGLGPADFGKPAPQQQFTAMGIFADKSQHDISARVIWSSSVPDVIAIDRNGLATIGSKAGIATIAATDAASAARGAALADEVKVTVTVPVLKALVISPRDATIAAGDKRDFTVVRQYSDDSIVDLQGGKGYVSWSASSDALLIDDDGHAYARQGGTVKLTVKDKETGQTGEMTLTVATEYSADTPFGPFKYFAGKKAEVLPLIEEANKAYDLLEGVDEQLDISNEKLHELLPKIPSDDEIQGFIHSIADRQSKDEAMIAKALRISVKILRGQLDDLQRDIEEAAENVEIAADDKKEAQDNARADELIARSAKVKKDMEFGAAIISAGINAALSWEDPVKLTKPAFDAFSKITIMLGEKTDPWLEEAGRLKKEAQQIGMANAQKKLDVAIKRIDALKKKKPGLEKDVADAESSYNEAIKTTERFFDKYFGGKIKFADITAAIEYAENTVSWAKQTEQAAVGARQAVKALARPSEAPSSWMADPAADQKIIDSMFEAATSMFDQAIPKRQVAEKKLTELQATYATSQKALFEAPGDGKAGQK